MSIASQSSAPTVPDLPLEILHQIAHILSKDLTNDAEATAILPFKNCSLANRSFAAAFHPYVFHDAFLRVGDEPEMKLDAMRKLEILTSFPHLRQHVKHARLSLSDMQGNCEGGTAEALTSLLNPELVPALESLEVVGPVLLGNFGQALSSHWCLLRQYLTTAIKCILDASTLKALAFVRIEAVPASLCLSSKTITRLSLRLSSLMFGSFYVPLLPRPAPPIALDLSGMDFSNLNVSDFSSDAGGFLPRVRSLTGTTRWDTDSRFTLNAFVSALVGISPLECLDMTIYVARSSGFYNSESRSQSMGRRS